MARSHSASRSTRLCRIHAPIFPSGLHPASGTPRTPSAGCRPTLLQAAAASQEAQAARREAQRLAGDAERLEGILRATGERAAAAEAQAAARGEAVTQLYAQLAGGWG